MTESNEYQSQTTSPPIDKPRDTRVHDDNYVLNELKRISYDSRDAFGKRIGDGTRNNLDIASQYNYTPERLRLFKNDARQFVQYNSISEFTDAADHWGLNPSSGDTMHLETAESGTYVVNYELQASWAFKVNQSLQNGDRVLTGVYNGSDGWYIEQRGSDHTDTQVDIVESVNGSETTLAADVELSKPITDWTRFETRYNWYSVGPQRWRQTYTEDGEQFNDVVAETSNDGNRGPETGNLNVWQEVEAGSNTTDLELQAGSMGLITLGDPTSLNRDKPQYESIDTSGTDNTWEPILAVRINPDNSDINMQLSDTAILNFGGAANVELVVSSMSPDKTDASNWSVPEYHHTQNSGLQSTTSVSEVPNDSGTQKVLSAGEKFGGFTVASSIDINGGNASGTAATATRQRQEKKSVLKSDVLVFLVRSTASATLDFIWDVAQNW